MHPDERLKRWKKHLKRLGLNPRQIADKMGINASTAYNWNCGTQDIPPKRLEQLEAMQ